MPSFSSNFIGVWQALQPPIFTSSPPRFTRSAFETAAATAAGSFASFLSSPALPPEG